MSYNYSKLLGRMKEMGYTQEAICAEIPMDRSVFSLRLNGKRSFRQSEIETICDILDIKHEDISKYFFAH